MVRLAWILTVAVAATGLALLVASAIAPGYVGVLWLHWALGWALLAVGLPALVLHLRATKSGLGVPLLLVAVVAICALPAINGVDAPDQTALLGYLLDVYGKALSGRDVLVQHVVSPTALLALVVVTVTTGVGGLLAPVQGRRSARWSGACIAVLVTWATATGAAQAWVHRDSLFLAISAHSATGGAAIVALGLHVLSSRLWKREAPTRRARAVLALALFGLGSSLFAVHRAETVAAHKNREDAAGASVARIPSTPEERIASTEGGDWFHLDPAVLRDSTSCAASGCHPDITDEWGGSSHRFAASNALYRAAVDELVTRRGLADAVFCAGCHDPERVLTGRMDEYVDGVPDGGSDGVSCLVCHGMIDAEGDPPSNGAFTVAAAPPAYPDHDPQGRRILRLDPRRHDQLLGVDRFVISPTPCKACHRLELGPAQGHLARHVLQNQALDAWEPGAEEVVCEECHLDVTLRDFDQYRHEMVGINADLALYGGAAAEADADRVAAVAKHAARQAGSVPWQPIDAAGWPQEPPPPPDQVRPGEGSPPRALGLTLEGRRAGGSLELRAELVNQRIGHAFPSGPFDLQQVWLELRVSDAAGAVLIHEGALDAQGHLVGTPRRLGARELGPDGQELRHHRLFELTAVRDKRVLPLGGAVEDAFSVPLPPESVGPWDVRARWLFRRVNPRFSRWAMGEESAPFPVWEVASARAEIR